MRHEHIFILTGAGISAESGLGTFRDADGVWTQVDLMDVATPEGFRRNPAKALGFYNARRENGRRAEANAAHRAIGRLQAAYTEAGRRITLVTQNVDDLHEKGGAIDVIHMHGEMSKLQCDFCGHVAPYDAPIAVGQACGACGREGRVRPHVVWFGEMPLHLDRIADAIAAADLFVAIGTSGAVYPAAGFVREARAMGVPTLELNLARSDGAHLFDSGRYGPATEVVPAWVLEAMAA